MTARRVLLTNAVPMNGGDHALVMGALDAIRLAFPGAAVSVACKDVARSRAVLPGEDVVADVEFAGPPAWSVVPRRVRHRIRRQALAHYPLPTAELARTLRRYARADLVVSCPGGFLNSHYRVADRLRGFRFARRLGKPVVVLGQSIGPFADADRDDAARTLRMAEAITVRDQRSLDELARLGVSGPSVRLTADMAFLAYRTRPGLYSDRPRRGERLALSLRPWPLGDTDGAAAIVAKGVTLVTHVLAGNATRTVTFLSTCQGIDGYVDDSEIALRVRDALPHDLRRRVTVDRAHRDPDELVRAYATFDAYIGMRLHGAILAMLAGTPATALGYESKSEEIFGQMGLTSYHCDHRAPAAAWIATADRLLADLAAVQRVLPDALDRQAGLAAENVDVLRAAVAHR